MKIEHERGVAGLAVINSLSKLKVNSTLEQEAALYSV